MAVRGHFDSNLEEIRTAIIRMGEKVAEAIGLSVRALQAGDANLARMVIEGDPDINRMETAIDELGTRMIIAQQPVAKDLRRILIAFKIASDLERMADLAVDIAQAAGRFAPEGLPGDIGNLLRMAELVQRMTEESIAAYTKESLDLAYKTAQMDDEADHLHNLNLQGMFGHVAANPGSINNAMLLGFVSRYLERIGDHATNIGEQVVYLVKGTRPDLN
jgi:phosphate transport system protein